jgi:hypothetical protein
MVDALSMGAGNLLRTAGEQGGAAGRTGVCEDTWRGRDVIQWDAGVWRVTFSVRACSCALWAELRRKWPPRRHVHP